MDDYEMYIKASKSVGSDLAAAVNYNMCEVTLSDLAGASVALTLEGENDGADWHWLVELADGRWAYINGGCDYTGWDCQSSCDAHIADSRAEAMKLCPEAVRAEYEAMDAAGETERDNTVSGW